MDEIWKDIEGYEGLYQVSNLGNVKSVRKNKLIGNNNHRGYRHACLCVDGKETYKSVHRLVADAFIPNPENLPCVNHKDENKLNNVVSNLEWCTYEYNNSYATKGSRISKSKFKPIQMINDGKVIKEFDSLKEAAEYVDGSHGNISAAANGKLHKAYGYYWRYKN